jgi:Zn-dependent peptidase ImmA (M78 family)
MAGVVGGDVLDTVRALLDVPRGDTGLVTSTTLPAMLFKSASPELASSDLLELARLCQPASDSRDGLVDLRRHSPPPFTAQAATQDGLDRAVELRERLAIDLASPLTDGVDLETVLLPKLGVRVADISLNDPRVDGVALTGPQVPPMIAVNRSGRFSRTPWGRRMTLAHELCHLLFDVGDRGMVGVVSNPWAHPLMERRANAFAAMLLMPPTALSALLPADPDQWSAEDLHGVMKTLGVGRTALTWHLYNLRWISESDRRAWLDEL